MTAADYCLLLIRAAELVAAASDVQVFSGSGESVLCLAYDLSSTGVTIASEEIDDVLDGLTVAPRP